jgi:hypothetical protein
VNRLSIEVLTPPTLLIGDVPRLLRLNRIGGETQPISDRPRLRRAGGAVLAQHQEAEEDASATDFLFMASEPGTELPCLWLERSRIQWHLVESGGSQRHHPGRALAQGQAPHGGQWPGLRALPHTQHLPGHHAVGWPCGFDRRIQGARWEPQDFVVDYDNRSGRRMIQLRIALNSIASPSELGIDAADHRRLGFMLSSITLNMAP